MKIIVKEVSSVLLDKISWIYIIDEMSENIRKKYLGDGLRKMDNEKG